MAVKFYADTSEYMVTLSFDQYRVSAWDRDPVKAYLKTLWNLHTYVLAHWLHLPDKHIGWWR